MTVCERFFHRVVKNGDIAEVGVGHARNAAKLCSQFADRTVHLFDTFKGLPREKYDPDIDKSYNKPGAFAFSVQATNDRLKGYGNYKLYEGLFPGTAIDGQFAFIHCDVDYYASTRDVLEWGWPRLVAGGLLLCDDYSHKSCPGALKACDEFSRKLIDEQKSFTREHHGNRLLLVKI